MTLLNGLSNTLLSGLLVATSITAAPPTAQSRCAAFMRENSDLVCMPLSVAKAVDIKLATAIRRYGWTLGCGTGAGLLVDINWRSQVAPVPVFCGATFGWRVK